MEKIICKLIEYYNFHRKPNYRLIRYPVRDGKIHKFALILPGGGYHRIDSYAEGYPYAKKLNRMGYHAFVLYYRYDEAGSWPIPLEDVKRAVRTIREHAEKWRVDPEGFSLWGGSAGGHLAAWYAAEEMPRPGALILAYPVITMGQGTHEGSRDFLLGKESPAELRKRMSMENRITPDFPPTYLWWGQDDAIVNPINSRLLHQALEEHHVPHMAKSFPGVDHGVGIGNGLPCEGWFEEAVRFWEDHQ